MGYKLYALLIALLSLNYLPTFATTYPNCNGFQLNSTIVNSSVESGICNWQGGTIYLYWRHGEGSGYTYSVVTYQNPNASLSVNGGGAYNKTSQCAGILQGKYYPQGDYLVRMTTEGTQVNQTCYRASVILSQYPNPTTSVYVYTTSIYYSTSSTTTIPQTSATTTLNITVSPSTPLIAISSNVAYVNQNITVTGRAVSQSDVVEIIYNGSVLSGSVGATQDSRAFQVPGNYTFQAYDVNLRLYSRPITVTILPPTTSSTISTSTKASTSVYTVYTTSIPTSTRKTTVPAGQQPGGGTPWYYYVVGVVVAAAIVYGLSVWRSVSGSGRTGP